MTRYLSEQVATLHLNDTQRQFLWQLIGRMDDQDRKLEDLIREVQSLRDSSSRHYDRLTSLEKKAHSHDD